MFVLAPDIERKRPPLLGRRSTRDCIEAALKRSSVVIADRLSQMEAVAQNRTTDSQKPRIRGVHSVHKASRNVAVRNLRAQSVQVSLPECPAPVYCRCSESRPRTSAAYAARCVAYRAAYSGTSCRGTPSRIAESTRDRSSYLRGCKPNSGGLAEASTPSKSQAHMGHNRRMGPLVSASQGAPPPDISSRAAAQPEVRPSVAALVAAAVHTLEPPASSLE